MFRRGYLIYRKISTSKPYRGRFRYTVDEAFGKYLFLTNTLSSGVLMLVGDVIQQEFQRDQRDKLSQRYDYGRLTRMFLVGLSMGPVHHWYYRYINILWPRRDLTSVTKKIVADQFIMSPICITQFFYTLGLLEGKTMRESTVEMANKFISVYTVDWIVWPPTQFLNFYLIPVPFQVIYINTVTMLYNVFLSYIKHDMDTNLVVK